MRKWPVKPDYIFADFLETVKWLIEKEKRKTERAHKRRESVIKIEPPPSDEETPEETLEETDRE